MAVVEKRNWFSVALNDATGIMVIPPMGKIKSASLGCNSHVVEFLANASNPPSTPAYEKAKAAILKRREQIGKVFDGLPIFIKVFFSSKSTMAQASNITREDITKDHAIFKTIMSGHALEEVDQKAFSQFIDEFKTNLLYDNLHSFIINYIQKRTNHFNEEFLKTLDITFKQVHHANMAKDPMYYDENIILESSYLPSSYKMRYLDNAVEEVAIIKLGFERSSWVPSKGIDALIKELRNFGPMIARGHLGPHFYPTAPSIMSKPIGNRSITFWSPSKNEEAPKAYGIAHSVMLVGALKSGHVLYMEAEVTDPDQADSRPIYIMTLETFAKRITDLSGQFRQIALVNKSEAPSTIGYLAYRKPA